MHCLAGSLLWQESLGNLFFLQKNNNKYYKYYKYHKFIGKKQYLIRFQL